jgi:aminotransferase EvaB
MMSVPAFDYLEQYRLIASEVEQAVREVLASGQLVLGPQVARFERAFADYLGEGVGAVAVNSGTDALAVLLMAMGIGPGDEVITVPNTAVPTVSAIRMAGATPVLCDVDPETALMDLSGLERHITPATRAVIAVHLYGNAVDIAALRERIGARPIRIIEDCAQAHGARLDGRMVGTLGDAAAFSFYPTKNLGAYGDGGACVSRDEALLAECRKVRMYGFEQTYCSVREGVNSRLDEVQAAVLNVKLPYLPRWVARRREIAAWYDEGLPPLLRRVVPGRGVEHAYHLYVVRAPQRDRLRAALAEQGVGTGIHYPYPIHRMPAYAWMGLGDGSLPVAERLAREVLSLPMYPELDRPRVQAVIDAVHRVMDGLP